MKISPTANASLWGCVALVAFAGIPMAILHPSFLGSIPMFGSLLVGVAIVRLAFVQWQQQRVQLDFLKVFPLIAIGIAVAMVLGHSHSISL